MLEQKLTVFFDSMCPVCSYEITMLKKKDTQQQIVFIDITGTDFDPLPYGLTMNQVVGSIHGLSSSGAIISGMELFRQVYRTLGYGWVWAWTEIPGIRSIVDAGYNVFAKIRPRFSRFKYQCDDHCKVP